jgi:hypothetical protein
VSYVESKTKKNQTDKFRSVQNSSGYGLTTTDVRLGNDEEVLGDDAEDEELNENGDKDQESDDEEKLSLNQKLMARMAHNINSFGTTLSYFVSKSVESTNTTNSLLRSHLASDSSLKSLNGSLEAERSSGASLSTVEDGGGTGRGRGRKWMGRGQNRNFHCNVYLSNFIFENVFITYSW